MDRGEEQQPNQGMEGTDDMGDKAEEGLDYEQPPTKAMDTKQSVPEKEMSMEVDQDNNNNPIEIPTTASAGPGARCSPQSALLLGTDSSSSLCRRVSASVCKPPSAPFCARIAASVCILSSPVAFLKVLAEKPYRMSELLEGEADSWQGRASLEEPDHSSSQWYFPRDHIESTSPSRLDGIDPAKEAYLRKSYCTFLQDLGMRLKVPQITIATAIVFCHRFFLQQSHARNDRFVNAHKIFQICSDVSIH
ncbi:hypothetical protein L7F22_044795 [Adiantum nelumboides]|nr:hypothetical protein [Adiantum nelumboides]